MGQEYSEELDAWALVYVLVHKLSSTFFQALSGLLVSEVGPRGRYVEDPATEPLLPTFFTIQAPGLADEGRRPEGLCNWVFSCITAGMGNGIRLPQKRPVECNFNVAKT